MCAHGLHIGCKSKYIKRKKNKQLTKKETFFFFSSLFSLKALILHAKMRKTNKNHK